MTTPNSSWCGSKHCNIAMYSILWAVEGEKKDKLSWFLTLIKMDCNITDGNEYEWTFINNRQKVLHIKLLMFVNYMHVVFLCYLFVFLCFLQGLRHTINEIMPSAEHRHCCKLTLVE